MALPSTVNEQRTTCGTGEWSAASPLMRRPPCGGLNEKRCGAPLSGFGTRPAGWPANRPCWRGRCAQWSTNNDQRSTSRWRGKLGGIAPGEPGAIRWALRGYTGGGIFMRRTSSVIWSKLSYSSWVGWTRQSQWPSFSRLHWTLSSSLARRRVR